MRLHISLLLFFVSFSLVNAAGQVERELCTSSSVTIGSNAGVTIQNATLAGPWGNNNATLYLPEKEVAEGAVLFSHSAIRANGSSTDLHPLAFTLVKAGAAVIMPERELVWPPKDEITNRAGAVVICAEQWLIDHSKVFNNGEPTTGEVAGRTIIVRTGFAYVGPRICDPTLSSECRFTDPFSWHDAGLSRYYRDRVAVTMGETDEPHIADQIISDNGLRVAKWLQRQLGLAPIQELATLKPGS